MVHGGRECREIACRQGGLSYVHSLRQFASRVGENRDKGRKGGGKEKAGIVDQLKERRKVEK